MKFRVSLVLVLSLLGLMVLSLATSAQWIYNPDSRDNPADLVAELRQIYELARSNRAASPDFLSDLEDLLTRFEALVVVQEGLASREIEINSKPVEISSFGSSFGSKEDIGKIFYFLTTGQIQGRIWGSGIYTNDTNVATSAVHAGILRPEQKGIVAIRILPGQKEYESSTQYGITSRSYGEYGLSYEFVSVDEKTLLIKAPGNLSAYSDMVGKSLAFLVTGSSDGGVWGTGIYTIDSNLGTAAVHAGLVRPGETAAILVEFLPGQNSYQGTNNFGITSSSYRSYPWSYCLKKLHH